MGVSLSEKAANEVKKIITEQNLPDGTVLRVGVQGGGCSGFSYSLGFDTTTSERDRVIEATEYAWWSTRNSTRTWTEPWSTTTTVSKSGASCSTTRTSSRVAAAAARSRFKFSSARAVIHKPCKTRTGSAIALARSCLLIHHFQPSRSF